MSEIEREVMEFDVVIVGAGPAGLSAAIRLKQNNPEVEICVLEKGAEVGSHILSGAVLDPIGLNTLIPDWKSRNAPLNVPVSDDNFYILGEGGQIRIPNWTMPPLMNNHGNYIVSMANICRWMAEVAEELEVEVYPGMACSELVFRDNDRVAGVIAGEFGKQPDGTPGENYEPGIEVKGKFLFLCEGARGSLSKQVIAKYCLDKNADHPKFGLGMKEIWEIDPAKHRPGRVTHTAGWPLNSKTGGGSFIYHAENNQVNLGFVVHLNYANPYLHPYMEFQRFKHHHLVSSLLEGGKRIAYGARAITEGGWQSIPKITFPGGVLVGCSVGLVNVPRIKGNHNAMLSGICAADAATEALANGLEDEELTDYEQMLRTGPISKDLRRVKNVKPFWSRYGLYGSLALGGLDMWCSTIFGGSPFGTIKHGKSDAASTQTANQNKEIEYPKPDGKISFDRLTNISYSGTNHEEGQPVHLQLADPAIPIAYNLPNYGEPAQRYCPAGVYEVVENSQGGREFKINYQNCVHCKTCDIKDPSQNINWCTPQGGDGPNYPNM